MPKRPELPPLTPKQATVSVEKIFEIQRPELIAQFRRRLRFGASHGKRGFRVGLRTVKAVYDEYFSGNVESLEALDAILGADWRQKSKTLHAQDDCPFPGLCAHIEYVRVTNPLRITWNDATSRISFCFKIEEVRADGTTRKCKPSEMHFFFFCETHSHASHRKQMQHRQACKLLFHRSTVFAFLFFILKIFLMLGTVLVCHPVASLFAIRTNIVHNSFLVLLLQE